MYSLIRNPRFRLFWVAGIFGDLSLIAYMTVHGWLALEVSGSPFWVGATAGVGGVAMVVFAPWGGVLIDRFRKKDVVRGASALRSVGAVALAALIFTETVQLWHVMLFAFAAGITASARIPGMKTLVMDISGRENLLAATAARMGSMTAVGVVVPLSIGPVVDNIGIGWAYVIVAAGDLLFVCMMSLLDTPAVERLADRRSPFHDLWSGVTYSVRHPLVRTILGMILISEVFGWSVEPMLPVIARDVLGQGASGLGMLFAAASGGAAVSAVALSAVGNVRYKGWLMAGGMIGFGAFLLMFAVSRSFPLSMALFAVTGAATTLYETAADTIMQSGVDSRMRGRVLSFQAMMWGISGVSGFYTGAMATLFGAPLAVGIGAVVVMLAGLLLTRRAAGFDRLDTDRDG